MKNEFLKFFLLIVNFSSERSRLLLLGENLFIVITIFSAQRILINALGYNNNNLRLSPSSNPKILRYLTCENCFKSKNALVNCIWVMASRRATLIRPDHSHRTNVFYCRRLSAIVACSHPPSLQAHVCSDGNSHYIIGSW